MTGSTARWLPSLRDALAAPADTPRLAGTPGGACEFCGEPFAAGGAGPAAGQVGGPGQAGGGPASGHGHVVDVVSRSIRCSCRSCQLLFSRPGAGGGRLRAVGDRWAYDPDFPLGGPRWAALEIPVGLAFLVEDSHAGRVALFYPSPAGATESMVAPERIARVWRAAIAEAPGLPAPEADIEAVLLHRPRERADDACEAVLLPVDACYGLIGRIRRAWSGFGGGPEVPAQIAAVLTEARRRAGRQAASEASAGPGRAVGRGAPVGVAAGGSGEAS